MNLTLVAVGIGGVLDALWGDPLSRAHPVVWIGKLIAALEQLVRRVFPDTPAGQKLGGGGLWLMVVLVSTALPAGILWLCRMVSPWLALAVESVMCWQVLALKCLCQEATRVERALTEEPLEGAQRAVARIVGRETHRLDAAGVTRAAVETVAETRDSTEPTRQAEISYAVFCLKKKIGNWLGKSDVLRQHYCDRKDEQ